MTITLLGLKKKKYSTLQILGLNMVGVDIQHHLVTIRQKISGATLYVIQHADNMQCHLTTPTVWIADP